MSSWGNFIKITIFGESHGPAVGVTLEGLPAGLNLDFEALQAFLNRRAPGGPLQSGRKEPDLPEFLSGLNGTVTCGTPITVLFRNVDCRSKDYAPFAGTPRPGHADFTAYAKYGPVGVLPGGGHFSGRLTAPLCAAGGICLQALQKKGIQIQSEIASIGTVSGAEASFAAEIAKAQAAGDSLGGTIACTVTGVPAGLGAPLFGGMESRLSSLLFGIPAVKGVEFGSGFAGSTRLGSENNDAFYNDGGEIRTRTNHAGGILGGITTGMPVRFRVAVKPTPSIAAMQETVHLSDGSPAALSVTGRHDPCIVPRALPCVEAAAAIAVLDALLEHETDNFFKD